MDLGCGTGTVSALATVSGPRRPLASTRKIRSEAATAAAPTASHSSRFCSRSPSSGGSSRFRSATVQYRVLLANAASPNGSMSTDSVSFRSSTRRRIRLTV